MSSDASRQAELAFVKNFAAGLSPHPVILGNDFQQPPEQTLKRVPIAPVCEAQLVLNLYVVDWDLQVDLPPPPEPKQTEAATSGMFRASIIPCNHADLYYILHRRC